MGTVARRLRWPLLTGTYLLLRASSSYGRGAARFPDSEGYLTLEFLGAGARLWPVPLLYTLVRDDSFRILLHVAAGSAAWVFLAFVVARRSRRPWLAITSILALGLAPQVIRYDLAILSESLGISFAVATIAATLLWVQSPTALTASLWAACLVVFAMTRPVQLVVLFAVGAAVLLSVAVQRRRRLAPLAAALCIAALWGAIQLRNNHPTSELNLYTVLQERILDNDSRFGWFVAHGMPVTPGMRAARGYDYRKDVDPKLLDYLDLPVGQAPPSLIRVGGRPLAEWVRHGGWRRYAWFVVTHPHDTWQRLSDLSERALDPPDGSFLPLATKDVFPWPWFGAWRWWSVAAAAALVLIALDGRRRGESYAVACGFGFAGVLYAAAVLASGLEHPRHAVTVAVGVRVLSLVALLLALDLVPVVLRRPGTHGAAHPQHVRRG